MGPRNLLILFFSTVAVSLVILIIFFSLFFKNVDLNFNTRLPESAPDIGQQYSGSSTMNPDSKADGLLRSTVNVPPEFQEPASASGKDSKDKNAKDNAEPDDNDLPPVSDDAALENDSDLPPVEKETMPAPAAEKPSTEKTTGTRGERSTSTAPANPAPSRSTRSVERKPEPAPVAMPEPITDDAPSNSGPPVPGQ